MAVVQNQHRTRLALHLRRHCRNTRNIMRNTGNTRNYWLTRERCGR